MIQRECKQGRMSREGYVHKSFSVRMFGGANLGLPHGVNWLEHQLVILPLGFVAPSALYRCIKRIRQMCLLYVLFGFFEYANSL